MSSFSLQNVATDASGNVKHVQPAALKVLDGTTATAAWSAAQALGTAKNIDITAPAWRTSSGALHVVVYNPSTVTDITLKIQDSDGRGNYADRQTYSGATLVNVAKATRASFIIDMGVGAGGSRLVLTNVAADSSAFTATVDAWQI